MIVNILEGCSENEGGCYRSDAIAFPVWMNLVSESSSFSECHARSRIARPYMFHQVGFMNKLTGGEIRGSVIINNQDPETPYLERLEEMLARRVPLSTIHHRMRREIRESVIRFMLVVE